MYISMKFRTGVHVFCWEVGVFNRSCFQSVSCNSLRFYFFFGLYCHGVLHHQSRKRELNFEELDVLFDQFVEGNSCISLRIT